MVFNLCIFGFVAVSVPVVVLAPLSQIVLADWCDKLCLASRAFFNAQ